MRLGGVVIGAGVASFRFFVHSLIPLSRTVPRLLLAAGSDGLPTDIGASRQHEQLQSALSTRDCIGHDKGIIMGRCNVDDFAAFDMLRRLSQDGNTKLTGAARRVIGTCGS